MKIKQLNAVLINTNAKVFRAYFLNKKQREELFRSETKLVYCLKI